MKLYATTTSERASKGQGGTELEIKITGEHKETIATIKVICLDNNYQLHLEAIEGYERTGKGFFHTLIGRTKGETIQKYERPL